MSAGQDCWCEHADIGVGLVKVADNPDCPACFPDQAHGESAGKDCCPACGARDGHYGCCEIPVQMAIIRSAQLRLAELRGCTS